MCTSKWFLDLASAFFVNKTTKSDRRKSERERQNRTTLDVYKFLCEYIVSCCEYILDSEPCYIVMSDVTSNVTWLHGGTPIAHNAEYSMNMNFSGGKKRVYFHCGFSVVACEKNRIISAQTKINYLSSACVQKVGRKLPTADDCITNS